MLNLGPLSFPAPVVMGILNITPDSFSDGGSFDNLNIALRQAATMADGGAAIIDIGGESTRPGSKSVSVQEEQDRIIPVIEAVKSLPTQSKLILLGIIMNEEMGATRMTTGDVYNMYKQLCRRTGMSVLTQRRITDLISELDMLGLVSARVKSFGRGGRTKEIQSSVPALETRRVLERDELLSNVRNFRLKFQTTLI